MLDKWRKLYSSRVKFPFGQNVRELVFGVDVFDLNLWIQIDSVKQPVKSNSVGSGLVSPCWTSASGDHLDHCFVVLDVDHRTESRRLRVRRNIINIIHFKSVVLDGVLVWFWVCLFDGVLRNRFPCTLSLDFFSWFGEEWNTSKNQIP